MPNILRLPIGYYIGRMKNQEYFSMAGYSDGEWFAMIGHGIGRNTGLGQLIDEATGARLLDVLKRRQHDPNFLFAMPECLWSREEFLDSLVTNKVDALLQREGIDIEIYERDMILDDLARDAGLYPLIEQLKKMDTVIIGNIDHRKMYPILKYKHFVEISCPNLHMEEGGIERAIEGAISYGKPAIYLVSAGMSAPMIVDGLHGRIPNSFFMDCGSTWDAFVDIGWTREWREDLKAKGPEAIENWIYKCLHGKDRVR